MVTCGFCQEDFEEDRGQPSCHACPLGADCGLIRCPYCGFENPATPKWIGFLQKRFARPVRPRTQSLPMLRTPTSGGIVS